MLDTGAGQIVLPSEWKLNMHVSSVLMQFLLIYIKSLFYGIIIPVFMYEVMYHIMFHRTPERLKQ